MTIRKYDNAVITKFQANRRCQHLLKIDNIISECVCALLKMGEVHKILLCGQYIWPNNDDKYCGQHHKNFKLIFGKSIKKKLIEVCGLNYTEQHKKFHTEKNLGGYECRA